VLPGLALLPAAGWTRTASPMLLLTLRTGAEAPGYSPVIIAVLLALVGFAMRRALRIRHDAPLGQVWNGGFAASPPWLPFGDPAAQFGPASFVAPLRRLTAMRRRIEIPSALRRCGRAAQRAAAAWTAP